jgi:hypothetical protein
MPIRKGRGGCGPVIASLMQDGEEKFPRPLGRGPSSLRRGLLGVALPGEARRSLLQAPEETSTATGRSAQRSRFVSSASAFDIIPDLRSCNRGLVEIDRALPERDSSRCLRSGTETATVSYGPLEPSDLGFIPRPSGVHPSSQDVLEPQSIVAHETGQGMDPSHPRRPGRVGEVIERTPCRSAPARRPLLLPSRKRRGCQNVSVPILIRRRGRAMPSLRHLRDGVCAPSNPDTPG